MHIHKHCVLIGFYVYILIIIILYCAMNKCANMHACIRVHRCQHTDVANTKGIISSTLAKEALIPI